MTTKRDFPDFHLERGVVGADRPGAGRGSPIEGDLDGRAGEFEALAGSSSQDIWARARFRLTDTVVFGGLVKGQ